jgi:hypothetical protein
LRRIKKAAPAPKRTTADRETRRIIFPPVKGREEGTTIAQTVSLEESKRFKESFTALRLSGDE